MDSVRLRPEASLAPIASAIACVAMSSLVTGANSTHQARPPNRACNCAATASASLVLPTPPGPISVTRRLESSAAVTPSHSLRRPTSAVTGAGMPERRVAVSPGAVSPGPGAVPGRRSRFGSGGGDVLRAWRAGSVVDLDRAERWIDRWDAQQGWYMPDREERFTVLIDAVEAGAGRDDPLVLDLGCGPGSLAVRLLGRMPAARVVAIDTDPLLLALGSAAYGDRPGLRFADQDLRVPGWAGRAGLSRAADAAVSTTALHWLSAGELRAMYGELATVLRPGGLLLDGDHLLEDEAAAPGLARLA